MSGAVDRVEEAVGPKKDRSPSFPYIPLGTAVDRTRAFAERARRAEVRLADAASAWGYGPKSSAVLQTAAALLAYGLIEDAGSGEQRKIKVSDLGRKILDDARPGAREAALQEAAMKPKWIAHFAQSWRDGRPDDSICISELKLDHGFTEEAAIKFLRVFDETMQLAWPSGRGNIPDSDAGKTPIDRDKPRIQVGAFIQWTNAGMDMFPAPARVEWVSDDGAWLRVEGSKTGIPMSEATVVPAPANPNPLAFSVSPAADAQENDIKVLLDGKRLRITASIDVKGLRRLKKILDAHAALLEDDENGKGADDKG